MVEVVDTLITRDPPRPAYTEQREDAGVETDLHRQVRDGRVCHRLRHHDGARRESGEHVAAEVAAAVPGQRGQPPPPRGRRPLTRHSTSVLPVRRLEVTPMG